MIAIHDENCYFVSTPDGKESNLVDNPTAITSRLRHTEVGHVWWTVTPPPPPPCPLSTDRCGSCLVDSTPPPPPLSTDRGRSCLVDSTPPPLYPLTEVGHVWWSAPPPPPPPPPPTPLYPLTEVGHVWWTVLPPTPLATFIH